MIVGIFHQGSGLGNQLHRYVMTRTLASDKGFEFAMANPENFKGKDFMNLDMGNLYDTGGFLRFDEKKVIDLMGVDIRGYDPEVNFVRDNTVIDGEFQDERYWGHRLDEIDRWLRVEPLDLPDDLCIIGFRGGEYALFPDLFLTEDYWAEAMDRMRDMYPDIKFEVHTDDVITARKFFPSFPIHHDIGLNWRSIRYAKHLIIANSSFYILPSLLSDAKEIFAPRYWARRNTLTWALPQNYYKRFTYL